jgi:DNA-binding MarR family transcriptional regulator
VTLDHRQAARHVTRLYDAALRPIGLGLNQYSILAKLERFGPQTIQELSTLLVMDRSTVGHLLRPLEQRALVTRDVAQADRRSRVVALTPAGRELMRAARPLWASAERRFERAFGTDDAVSMRRLLKRVTATELQP